MKKKWYVIDSQERIVSYDSDLEIGEEFTSRDSAIKRATKLAEQEPHKAFYVVSVTDVVFVETKPVAITSV